MKLLKLITLALIIFAIPACSDNEPTEEKKQSAYADWVNAMRNHDNEKAKHEQFYVELQPLHNFYEAEEYHQYYLEKNPDGYCHITIVDINKVKELNKK